MIRSRTPEPRMGLRVSRVEHRQGNIDLSKFRVIEVEGAPVELITSGDSNSLNQSSSLILTVFEWTRAGESVGVMGSFNKWGDAIPLTKQDGRFFLAILLPVGEHQFKYLVDGCWNVDLNYVSVDDAVHGTVNVLTVASDSPCQPFGRQEKTGRRSFLSSFKFRRYLSRRSRKNISRKCDMNASQTSSEIFVFNHDGIDYTKNISCEQLFCQSESPRRAVLNSVNSFESIY
ncbi:5'-AMP-activated protein kinase subunit beta-1 [Thelohanellus kitauei]|uniref:5'-AMP-activated protein kinase subunit beta-1 n=1 Tax=Thelohanellus kitauei TaxID=669202 RepID=A0A0C2I9F8_THEKT|nr:5'-AMP-activated protein kinase subunit beta-1 [Thelohanellus kitauei]